MNWVLRDSRPVARKCSLCEGVIKKGEQYDRAVMLSDDGLYEWVNCQPCRTVQSALVDWLAYPEEGYCADDAIEWAREHQDDPNVGAVARAYLDRRASARKRVEVGGSDG